MVFTACDHKNKASSAFHLPHNSRWLRLAVGGVAEEPTTDRRVVTFTELFKRPLDGVQAGTNPAVCHILFGSSRDEMQQREAVPDRGRR